MGSDAQRKTAQLFDLDQTIARSLFVSVNYPWEILSELKYKITGIAATLNQMGYEKVSGDIWLHESCKISKSAVIDGACIIGKGTEIRKGAYIRGPVIIGDDCIVGNSTEVKNSILFNGVQAAHFNYIGDSILGYCSHLGAGTILSNLRLDKSEIQINFGDKIIDTGLKKLGAIIGDFVEIGCNCVVNPGTIVGSYCRILPLLSIKGVIPKNSVIR